MAGCFHDGCVNPKSAAPDQLLSYCIKISANVQHRLVLFTYTFIVPKSDYRSNRLYMFYTIARQTGSYKRLCKYTISTNCTPPS